MKKLGLSILICAALAAGVFTGCASSSTASNSATTASYLTNESVAVETATDDSQETSEGTTAIASASDGVLDTTDLFTDRDMEQTADTTNATAITVSDGQDVDITEEGVYVISGTATDCTITVTADDTAKVQLVLDGVSITNSDAPAIYVVSADKVFVTTAEGSTNELSVTGTFTTSSEDNVDGVIFAKDDLVLNGTGTLSINSSDNGIVGKDDVKVTGGTYAITATGHGIEGKDSVAIADGTFTIQAGVDSIHAENADDQEKGYVYIAGGTFSLNSGSDGIEGASIVQIDDGTLDISGAEGIESTYVQINGGTIAIDASDDGINATSKSTAYSVVLEINGGATTVNMGSGDTDALDSNGNLFINGGTVDITAQSAFDYDGEGALNGGTVIVNGEEITTLENSMMGPGGMGNMGGQGGPNGQGNMGGQGGPNGQGGMGGHGGMM